MSFWYWLTWVVPEKGPLNVCSRGTASRLIGHARNIGSQSGEASLLIGCSCVKFLSTMPRDWLGRTSLKSISQLLAATPTNRFKNVFVPYTICYSSTCCFWCVYVCMLI